MINGNKEDRLLMRPQDFVLLVLETVGGNVVGCTKLQNIVFCAAIHTDSLSMLRYKESGGVQHSHRVSDAITALRKAEAISVYCTFTVYGDGNWDVPIHEYDVTYSGEKFVDGLCGDPKYTAVVQALNDGKQWLSMLAELAENELTTVTQTLYEDYCWSSPASFNAGEFFVEYFAEKE